MVKGLNRSSIEWTKFTWNPVTGCENGCSYCYAETMCRRFAGPWGLDLNDPFKPTFHADRLMAPRSVRKPSKIFLESMGEMWGPWVPQSWQEMIINAVEQAPQHTFLCPSKLPLGMVDWQNRSRNYLRTFPRNLWLGVSVESSEHLDRLHVLREEVGHLHKFVSFEPLLEDVTSDPSFSLEGIGWVIIGSMTGPMAGQNPTPPLAVGNLFVHACRKGIPVFIKDNVKAWPNCIGRRPQQFPEGFP